MKTNHRLAHFCILRKEKGEGRKRVSEAGGGRRGRGCPWKMPPVQRNRRKGSAGIFCGCGERGEETDEEFRGRREVASPQQKGQNAHVFPYGGTRVAILRPAPWLWRPGPSAVRSPARPRPAPAPPRSNPAHVPGLVSMGRGAPGPCAPRR